MTTTTAFRGHHEHGPAVRVGTGGNYQRQDTYVPRPNPADADDWQRIPADDPAWCTGPDDHSAHHPIGRGYDASCSWCWLGYPHTTDEHARHIEDNER